MEKKDCFEISNIRIFFFSSFFFFCRNLNVLPREIIIRIAFARRIDRFIKAMVNSFECLSLSLYFADLAATKRSDIKEGRRKYRRRLR